VGPDVGGLRVARLYVEGDVDEAVNSRLLCGPNEVAVRDGVQRVEAAALSSRKGMGAPRHEITASTPSKTPPRLSGLVASPVEISSAIARSAWARAGFLENAFSRWPL
jgi:hypothetical protein